VPRRRLAALALALTVATAAHAGLAPEVDRALESKYVYVQSRRRRATLGKPAEIWFH
jgi:hypothetical protein